MATAAPMSNTYFSTMAAHRISRPQPTTNAATLYRLKADRIFGGTTGLARGAAGPAPDALSVMVCGGSVSSPVGSTGTAAVLLGQGCQRLVVSGQFWVVIVIFADHCDR